MAEPRLESHDPDLPPPAEVVHMPDPSYLPVLVAFGILLIALGFLTNYVILALGVILSVVMIFRWIGQTRREMAELPLEH
jgi:hypothetical protein